MIGPRKTPFFLGKGERYEVTRLVAEGGTAQIYMAFDRSDRAWRAIKILRAEYRGRTDTRKRMQAEAEALGRLDHPNILRVFEWSIWGTDAWIAMEYASRGSAGHWCDAKGPMPIGGALELIRQVCVGVEYAHSEGIVHRDLKPHNVLVNPRGQGVVADFGIAAMTDEERTRITKTGATLGTMGYMAPEQFDSAKTVDGRADVYSLAATLFHLLLATEPSDLFFTATRHPGLAEVPEPVKQIVIRGSRRRRSDRYPSVSDFRQAVESLQDEWPLPDPDEFPLLHAPAPPPLPEGFGPTLKSGPPTFDLESVSTVAPTEKKR